MAVRRRRRRGPIANAGEPISSPLAPRRQARHVAAAIASAVRGLAASVRGELRFAEEAIDLSPMAQHVNDRVFEHLLDIIDRPPS